MNVGTGPLARAALAAAVALPALVPAGASAAPNDDFFSFQWGMVKIQAEAAWAINRGQGTIVAVVDTGVDRQHPDLAGRVMKGKDFVDGDADADDENGHGTLIAGIIAAVSGNGEGVASVAPKAKILPVRVLDHEGTGTSDDVADGIDWAVGQGAHIINLSLAQEQPRGGAGESPEDLLRDPAVGLAIERAAGAGATVVIAAGNNSEGGEPATAYDATLPGAIVVGASTTGDKRAAYSNHGTGLDVLAPGGGSGRDPSDDGCTQDNAIVSTWWDPSDGESKYGGGCGTSMAVGFVSGVAALLNTKGLSNSRIVSRIIATAVDLGPDGWDAQTGHGRINARRAVGAPKKKPSTPKPEPKPVTTPSGTPTPVDPVVVQGSPEPAPSPSGTPRPSPPPLAAPLGAGTDDTPAGVVALASALVLAVIGEHLVRLLRH